MFGLKWPSSEASNKKKKKKVLARTITYFLLIRYGPHRKQRARQLYCWIFLKGSVITIRVRRERETINQSPLACTLQA